MALERLREDLAHFAEIKSKPRWRALIEGLLFDNGFQAVFLHRVAHWLRSHRIPALGPAVARLNLFLTGVDISPAADIGGGLIVAHGVGLVVGGGSRIGRRGFLLQQVTLGAPSQARLDQMPTLGDEVFVGAGARIIGPVRIGDRAVIGTNAVVTRDIPANHRVVVDQALKLLPPRRRVGVTEPVVLEVGDLAPGALEQLLAPWGIEVVWVEPGTPIPSSYFGAPEAGIRGSTVFVRPDTPVHSALHEAFHLVCAGRERRQTIDTDAGDGDFVEEVAVCYLQLAVADCLPGFGFERACADMDAWGYTFRLGSARQWFDQDAEDAIAWLAARGLLDAAGRVVVQVT